MRDRKRLSVARTCLVAAMMASAFAGCKKEEKKLTPAATAPQVSAVMVESLTDGIHLRTAQAEFVLTATGNLLARRMDGAATVTMDEARSTPGVAVKSGKQVIGEFPAGKRIEKFLRVIVSRAKFVDDLPRIVRDIGRFQFHKRFGGAQH